MFVVFLSGCANTMNAIENKELKVDAKMSDTIFLEAETLAEAMPGGTGAIFGRVANTSDFQEIDFADAVRNKLTAMGYTITRNPKEASYLVAANLLYLNESKKGMNMGSVLSSGFGGAILGAGIAGASGSSWRGAGAAGLATGLIAAGIDGAAGLAFKVKEYIGILDLQIKEEVPGGVEGTQEAALTNGMGGKINTTPKIKTTKQEYRTRIAVNAKQTNMKREEATQVIAERLSGQVSRLFKM